MIYLKRSKRPNRSARVVWLAIALVLAALVIGWTSPTFFSRALYPITSVMWRSESSTANWFVDLASIMRSKYSLVEENRALRSEIAVRDRSTLMLGVLESENESLKQGFGRTGKGNDLLASVLVRPPVSPYDTLVIDAGTRDGVSVGDRVYAEGDVLIGDVSEAFGSESQVALYSTPGRTTEVLVGTSTISASAVGRGGGGFSVKLPATAAIMSGAIVTMPGMRAHTFGIVESVTPDPTDSLATVLFKSPANVSELRYVVVDRTK